MASNPIETSHQDLTKPILQLSPSRNMCFSGGRVFFYIPVEVQPNLFTAPSLQFFLKTVEALLLPVPPTDDKLFVHI